MNLKDACRIAYSPQIFDSLHFDGEPSVNEVNEAVQSLEPFVEGEIEDGA